MKTKILRDSLFVIALLFCGIAKSQDTLKVDEFRHIYNFKLGDPKSSFEKYALSGIGKFEKLFTFVGSKGFIIDTSLIKNKKRVFSNHVEGIRLSFDKNDMLNKIMIYFSEHDNNYKIEAIISKHCGKPQNTAGSMSQWSGKQINLTLYNANANYVYAGLGFPMYMAVLELK